MDRCRSAALIALAGLALAGCGSGAPSGARSDHRLVVLGIDGLDPGLLEDFIAEGRPPDFAAPAQRGGFLPPGPHTPPPSPRMPKNAPSK